MGATTTNNNNNNDDGQHGYRNKRATSSDAEGVRMKKPLDWKFPVAPDDLPIVPVDLWRVCGAVADFRAVPRKIVL